MNPVLSESMLLFHPSIPLRLRKLPLFQYWRSRQKPPAVESHPNLVWSAVERVFVVQHLIQWIHNLSPPEPTLVKTMTGSQLVFWLLQPLYFSSPSLPKILSGPMQNTKRLQSFPPKHKSVPQFFLSSKMISHLPSLKLS